MLLEEKKEFILNSLGKNQIVKIKELGEALNCTEASIRYIVNDLAKINLLKRVHGGIKRVEGTILHQPEGIVSLKNQEDKEYISNIAFNLVKDKTTIILDSGTTNYFLAKKIAQSDYRQLNIITTNLKIANLLVENRNINVILSGGLVKPLNYSIINFQNLFNFNNLRASQLFLNVAAFSIKDGLTETSFQESESKKKLIESVRSVILLADSSKIEKVALSLVCQIDDIDIIISDKKTPQEFIKKIRKEGITFYN